MNAVAEQRWRAGEFLVGLGGDHGITYPIVKALTNTGKKVGIIDADIYGFSVPDMMGITEKPGIEDKTIIPVERFGVKVISMAFFV
ncbi:P-loop NTPase, partial [Planococcus sp. SIMBA_143]